MEGITFRGSEFGRGHVSTNNVPRLLVLLFLAVPLFASDVTIAWVGRTPELDYVWGSTNPRVDGWPLSGSTVTWRAHVRNSGSESVTRPYAWRVDDAESARGTVTLAPNAITVVELPP